MSSAGAGSVGIRFFIAGGEIVQRTFDQIRDAGKRMWSEIANGQKSAAPGIRALNAASTELKDSISDVAAEAGGAGRVLVALGPAGLAAAVGIGALVLSLDKMKQSIGVLSKLGDFAERSKLPVQRLQEIQYAISQRGGEPQDADVALEQFNNRFGGARGGFRRDLLPFQELGFSKDDVAKFKDLDDALKHVADRIAKLSNPAEQSAIADKLGIGPLLPLLRDGAAGLDTLGQKAHQTGNTLDTDLIVRTQKLDDKLKSVAGTIGNSFNSSFARMGLLLDGVIVKAARFAEMLGLLPGSLKGLADGDGFKSLDDLKGERKKLYDSLGNDEADPQKIWARIGQLEKIIGEREMEIGALNGTVKHTSSGDSHLIDVEGQQQAIDQKNQQQKRFDAAMRAAMERQLAAENDDTKTIEERLQLGLQRLEMEQNAETEELARQVKAKELTAAQAAQVKSVQEDARQAEADAMRRKADREKVQVLAAYDQEMSGYALDLLQISEQMTVILRDRLQTQLRIYDAERAQERAAIVNRQKLDPNRTPDQNRRELDAFDQVTKQGRAGILKEANGLEQTVHDAFRNGVLSGLQDGPLAAIHSFFDSIAKRFADKLADNVSDSLTKAFDSLIDYVAKSFSASNPLGGGNGDMFDSIGGFIGDLFSSGGGRAAGGNMQPGYAYRTAEHDTELALIGRSGRVFDHDATMRILGGNGAKGDTHVHASFAPTYNVQGSGEEIAALRQQMERDKAEFRPNVLAAVNDGHRRGMISTQRL